MGAIGTRRTVGAAVSMLMSGLLAALALAPGAHGRSAEGTRDSRPNILVVMTDDMATTDIEFMPNVQRLLQDKGTTFADAVDSFPLCCPARATFLTGQYAHNHGVIGNFHPYGWYGFKGRKNTLPAWLQDAGYRTGAIGKWLNGYGARDGHGEIPAGFDIWRGLLDVSAYDYYNYVMNADGKLRTWGDAAFAAGLVEFAEIQVHPNPSGLAGVLAKLREVFGDPPYEYWGTEKRKDYSTDVTGKMTDELVRRESGRKKPFFLWWSPAAPHREDVAVALMGRPGPDPRPPKRHSDDVSGLELPQGPSFNEADIADKSTNLTDTAAPLGQDEIDQLELDYQGRAGSLMAVDDRVGDLVQTLRKTGQLRNTYIVFLSDNGWLHGQHRVPGDKFLPFDESLRVPLIIRGPGVPRGKTIRGQVSNVDFAPTLLDMAGARSEARRTLDGVSLLPGLRDKGRRPDRVIAIEALAPLFEKIPVNPWDRPYSGVRTDRYTYVVWTETGERELYDRKKDPYELDNVAGDPAYADTEAKLRAKWRKVRDCAGDRCDVRQ